VKQFLDCVMPFYASICECSSENKRHTHDWVMKMDITWEHGSQTVPVCACFRHLSLTLKPVSFKLPYFSIDNARVICTKRSKIVKKMIMRGIH
jgi:hypothetical protein